MDIKKEHASYVSRHDGTFCLTGTVMESKGIVALRPGNDSFDELNLAQILLLSNLCIYERPRDAKSISRILDADETLTDERLTTLCELGFAEETDAGYNATQKGRDIISELAIEVIRFDRLKYKQGLQEIEHIGW